MSIIQGTSKAAGGGYEIDQSIRFDNVDGINAGGAQMYRLALTGTPTNDKKATISAWVKRATLGYNQNIAYSGDPNGSTMEALRFNTNDTITFSQASSVYTLTTTQVFRDVGAWYHIVAEIDTANGTAADRANLYVNGEKVTSFSTATYPSLNYVTNWTASSASIAHTWGTNGIPAAGPSSQLFAGYMAEMYVLDGEKAGPTAFGEFNDSGVWIPKAYSGAFGNNGYHQTGENASALGEDFSGNNLDFTTVALATTDQMLDTPTLSYCTLSPLDKFGGVLTLSDGNLRAVPSASAYCNNHGTFYVNSGKWVFEVKHTTVFGEACGWSPMGERIAGSSNRGYFMFADGRAYINTSNQGTKGASLASGDYRYIFYDADLEAMWFAHVDVSSSTALVYDNSATKAEIEAGTTTNAVFTSIQDVDFAPGIWMDTDGVIEVNFGQSAFITSSDLPTGFNTLNTANLATPSITDGSAHFNPVLFTGNSGTAFSVTGVGFQPDFVWGKPRSYADNHRLMDVVRGSTKQLITNVANAEFTQAQGITSFDSDGFTVGTHNGLNTGTNTYVGWCWLADNTTGSSNTDGSITSTVSANTTSGFSISTYTGNATVGATVGHGLGIAPKVVIVKSRSNAENWIFGHDSVGWNKAMYMSSTGAPFTLDIYWNNTAPTSSVVELHDHPVTNGNSYTYVMYAFAEIPGYSSFGSYTGNGSSTDGPFVWTGFSPKYILYKSTTAGTRWGILDTDRSASGGGNSVGDQLFAELTAAEANADHEIDFLSNGFKVRDGSGSVNGSGYTITYMSFAENPFGGDGVAPATAR